MGNTASNNKAQEQEQLTREQLMREQFRHELQKQKEQAVAELEQERLRQQERKRKEEEERQLQESRWFGNHTMAGQYSAAWEAHYPPLGSSLKDQGQQNQHTTLLSTHHPPPSSGLKSQAQSQHQRLRYQYLVWDEVDWDSDDATPQIEYTKPDEHLCPSYHQEHKQQNWRDVRRANKTPTSYTPRQKKGRKGRGDLFMDDYHAGYSKLEIHAMSNERKANFEVQRLKRE
ncbi:hypothetical protein EC991_003329 [Linnemannia zychae]|nr:hypothetical protein EC991_003329 [Linnemannia zychae]